MVHTASAMVFRTAPASISRARFVSNFSRRGWEVGAEYDLDGPCLPGAGAAGLGLEAAA
jgi:hypothetical protein